MAGQVFVLGAGFSRNAGMPLVQELRQEVFLWLAQNRGDPKISVHMGPLSNWPEFPEGKFRAAIRRVDPQEECGFEELMIRLRSQFEAYPVCVQGYEILRYACTRLLWAKQNALDDVPASYSYFARMTRNEVGIISFNWDLVCERALDGIFLNWGYSAGARIPVIKPHGSLNWVNHLMQEDWGRAITNPAEFEPITTGSTISSMPRQPFEDPLLTADSDDLRCLIFPGCDDLLEYEPGARAKAEKLRLWEDALSLIKRASTVVFIGYSLPSYDLEARQRFASACRGKVVVVCNPSADAVAEFRSVFRGSRVLEEPYRFEESRFGAAEPAKASA